MRKAERTKQFIVEQTATLFNKKGFAATSLSDMISATGLTKGSIYGNFSNKDEVALAVFDYNLSILNGIISAELEKRSTFKAKLRTYVEVYSNFSRFPFPEGGCPVMNTSIEADDTHPQLSERAKDAILSWKSGIAQLISQGIANNEFQNTVNSKQAAFTIIALIEGSMMIASITKSESNRKLIMQSLDAYIEGLC
ncbi:MAG: TetR/AcrR family transcriptional regulator [Chitinophagaceae bacterium]|nr:TetR/AcrR family transcriptional regulator [Chitinophagaceae bacterium]